MDAPRLSRVTAVLARGPDRPSGDTGWGLEMELCLSARGQIEAACATDTPWHVRRFWPDRKDWHGELVAVDGGWGIRGLRGDDEPVWELQGRILRPGEYVTLVGPDNAELLFRIVNVETVS
ncbi:MAG TPA: hypothetical protein VJ779_00655 [Acetobacteraceae bacterium]|jgi:hypothetical protein|nr:hypothetical protein [Acetobacteraceae bacterium]